MIWDEDEREQRIKEIKDILEDRVKTKSVSDLPKTENSDKIVKERHEEYKKELLDSIIKDKDGNWIGIINVHVTIDPIEFLPEFPKNKMEDSKQMKTNNKLYKSQKYKWFNKMKDEKEKKDYSKMSQEELKEEARKIEVIDDDGSTVTIGELIERDKNKTEPTTDDLKVLSNENTSEKSQTNDTNDKDIEDKLIKDNSDNVDNVDNSNKSN